jgi:hypothetical protein
MSERNGRFVQREPIPECPTRQLEGRLNIQRGSLIALPQTTNDGWSQQSPRGALKSPESLGHPDEIPRLVVNSNGPRLRPKAIYAHMIHRQEDEAVRKWEEFQNRPTGGAPQQKGRVQ